MSATRCRRENLKGFMIVDLLEIFMAIVSSLNRNHCLGSGTNLAWLLVVIL
jgi:hypothetical protein